VCPHTIYVSSYYAIYVSSYWQQHALLLSYHSPYIYAIYVSSTYILYLLIYSTYILYSTYITLLIYVLYMCAHTAAIASAYAPTLSLYTCVLIL
jgi:hypothetical protein